MKFIYIYIPSYFSDLKTEEVLVNPETKEVFDLKTKQKIEVSLDLANFLIEHFDSKLRFNDKFEIELAPFICPFCREEISELQEIRTIIEKSKVSLIDLKKEKLESELLEFPTLGCSRCFEELPKTLSVIIVKEILKGES